ncbi:ATP synthase subunit b [bacterium BMS3Bbin06]|nr:ATP synthase subunit b [bacterium BMS3Abin08]GBE35678.1 ATP synthase subunit b [bacterium BMS3Bbin06]
MENLRSRIKKSAVVVLSALLISAFFIIHNAVVYAAEEGASSHGGDWKEWLWRIVNFAILIFILVKFLSKPMKEYFRKRSEVIEQSLTEAREAKELAQKALKEVQEKLALRDQEIEKIIASARKSGESERDSLIEQGTRMSEKIKEQARANIELELKNAKAALRSEAAELAIKLAEKKLRENLTEEEQLKIIEESIRKLEG